MMIIFQNKIIYMPGLPPNARRETISDYVAQCSGITWREERIRASDGTEIALCVTTVENKAASTGAPFPIEKLIIYFQGKFVWPWPFFVCMYLSSQEMPPLYHLACHFFRQSFEHLGTMTPFGSLSATQRFALAIEVTGPPKGHHRRMA
jgi:hypothetical protein